MGYQDVIIVMEDTLERMRDETRRMREFLRADQVALEEKANECVILMRKKQSTLADEAANQKLVEDFIFFIDAIDNNDNESTLNFDEKAMMNAVLLAMMNGGGGDNGGFAADDDDGKNEP